MTTKPNRLTDAEVLAILNSKHTNGPLFHHVYPLHRALVDAAYAAGAASVLRKAASDVLAERERQQSGEGWNTTHDDDHDCGELALAAACYAESAMGRHKALPPAKWPWHLRWWKPTHSRRDLVKAGALILAEIERLDRSDAAREPKRETIIAKYAIFIPKAIPAIRKPSTPPREEGK